MTEKTLYPHEILLKYKYLLLSIIIAMSTLTLIIYILSIIIPSINPSINDAKLMQPMVQQIPCYMMSLVGIPPILIGISLIIFYIISWNWENYND